jgi:hypothetical protein
MTLRLPFTFALASLVACGGGLGGVDTSAAGGGGAGGAATLDTTCPAEEPEWVLWAGATPLPSCGADRTCAYDADPECPHARTCAAGLWSYEDWPADGTACAKPNKVCVYPTGQDGGGVTTWTYCTTAGIRVETHWGYDTVCPIDAPVAGGPCPVSGKPCNYGTGCDTVTALCDETAGWQVTPMPCP